MQKACDVQSLTKVCSVHNMLHISRQSAVPPVTTISLVVAAVDWHCNELTTILKLMYLSIFRLALQFLIFSFNYNS